MDKQMLSGHQAGGDKFPDFKNYLPDWNKVKHSCKKVIFIYSKLIFYIGFVSFFFVGRIFFQVFVHRKGQIWCEF